MPPAANKINVYTAVPKMPSTALFDRAEALEQRHGQDLAVYCKELNMVVRIAWCVSPLSSSHLFLTIFLRPTVGNLLVPPNHLRQYLNSMGLQWQCFCAMHTGINSANHLSSSLLSSADGVFAFCHHFPASRCQFFCACFHYASTSRTYTSQ